MAHRSSKRLGTLAAAVLLLAACGSDDEEGENGAEPAAADENAQEPAAEPAVEPSAEGGDDQPVEEPSTDEPSPAAEPVDVESEEGDDDTVVLSDLGDIPGECVDLVADFLREIEPSVSGIDWEGATLEELETLGTAIDAPGEEFDRRAAEIGCDQYEIGPDDERGLDFAIEVAQREAPGTVGWLEFIASFATIGETVDAVQGMDDESGGEVGAPGPDGDLPTDCEGTKAYLLAAAEEYGTFANVPAGEFSTLSTAVQNLTVQCTIDDALAFYEEPAISAFLDG